jgi:hypothetical protein
MKKIIYIIAALLMLAPLSGWAQSSTDSIPPTPADSVVKEKNVFSGSINYQSELHYFGRVDSFKSSGLFPILGYEFKNGIYAEGTAVFVQNAFQPLSYTGASVEAGYNFPERKHFEGKVFVSKFFYQDQSTLVQSALREQAGISMGYKNKIVNVNAGFDLKFSDETDMGASAGIDHLFVMPVKGWDKAKLAVMPSVTMHAGTQNFSTTYIKKDNFLGVPFTREKTEQVKKFDILAYELSAPVVLVAGKFNAYVMPSYVIPQNLVISEKGENLFYVTLGFGFKL